MSHHYDTPTAREDPRLNVCDFYLFRGRPGTTVMAMTVNPNAGVSSPDTFRDEGLYAFRFDLDGDAREEVAFKVRFDAPGHSEGDTHRHVQTFEVRHALGADATHGPDGALIVSGRTGETVEGAGDIKVFAGLAPDLFCGDAKALHAFQAAYKDGRFDLSGFAHGENAMAGRNVTAIVLEVPATLIGTGRVHAWATVSLFGHAPEVQVSRWGLPHVSNIFIADMEMREAFNRAPPAEDIARFAGGIAGFAEGLTRLAGTTADPGDYARQLAARLCPTTLPYDLDTPANFTYAGFNGRALSDDVFDIMLTLAANRAIADGVSPDRTRMRADFPYFGAPF